MIYTGIITIQKTTNALNNTCLKYFCTLKGTRVLTTSSRHINAIASIKRATWKTESELYPNFKKVYDMGIFNKNTLLTINWNLRILPEEEAAVIIGDENVVNNPVNNTYLQKTTVCSGTTFSHK